MLLVRHALPDANPTVPPQEWPLSAAGRAAAAGLVAAFPADAYLVASAEPKAWQTVQAGDRLVRQDARFNEVLRRGEPWGGAWRELRRAYVDGEDHAGWEARTGVIARFDAAINEHRAAAGARPLVVATHGMAMTIWLTAAVELHEPCDFWADLRFPDLFAVDLAGGTVSRRTWSR